MLVQSVMVFEEDSPIDNELINLLSNNTTNEKKDLLIRSTGRFYTHELIGKHLVETIAIKAKLFMSKTSVRVIDPFCGDGRLVNWLLHSLYDINKDIVWHIELWDLDPFAVKIARENVIRTSEQLGITVEVNSIVCDTLEYAPDFFGRFDICITNPPWETLKPDKRELTNLDRTSTEKYVNYLRDKDRILSNMYPISAPTKRFAGWGFNLARCGTEVAIRLVSNSGLCGVVSPASLLADQTSTPLRNWVFSKQIFDVSYFVAEARLFENVDQACITVTLSPEANDTLVAPKLTFFDREQNKSSLNISDDEWKNIGQSGYIIPLQFGLDVIRLNHLWSGLKQLSYYENTLENGLWSGRELDETRIDTYLISDGKHPFLKGRMVDRYKIIEPPTKCVDEQQKKVPMTTNFYRIVWRDVSRPTQKRRLIATIIPPGYVTGNSLSVIYFRDNNISRLKSLLAIMNSFVFEAQVRTNLATNHVSLGVVRNAYVPPLDNVEIVASLSELVDRCFQNDLLAYSLVEVEVAKIYGLTYSDFTKLLSLYTKLSENEKEILLREARTKLN
ncbi:Alw26I/Eco31I/Esp3I family type II restriction adenine-specific DNA-methyltransferase [Paenibacillus jamilae]|nr:Alw26I/Eco31I/Esp3I family type II restriction adenine-specific DNA-methyltransferase [Paenibacillus jamilae]